MKVLYNDGTWSLVQALDGRQGYVRWDVLTPVNNEVAQQFINEYNARTATPTPVPAVITPLPQMPAEQTGYARVAVEYAPYRQMPGEYSNIINWLPQNEVVYVVGQVYDTSDPNPWHIAMYGQDVGYIRYDHLRMMSEAEVFSLASTHDSMYVELYIKNDANARYLEGYTEKWDVTDTLSAKGIEAKYEDLSKTFNCLVDFGNVIMYYHVQERGVHGATVNSDALYHSTKRLRFRRWYTTKRKLSP